MNKQDYHSGSQSLNINKTFPIKYLNEPINIDNYLLGTHKNKDRKS